LKREFDPVRLRLTVNACRLEFQFVQKEIAQLDPDYRWTGMALKCDYKMLKHLMKESGMKYTRRERLLIAYFSALSVVASVQQAMKLNQKATMMKQTGIVQYFASTMGEDAEFAAVPVGV